MFLVLTIVNLLLPFPVVLDYNLKYKINVHESILIKIIDQINIWGGREAFPMQKNSK